MAKRKPASRPEAPPATSTSRPPSRWRTWLGRATLAVGVPVLFLLGIEGVLRVSGFGYDPHFFVRAEDSSVVGSNVEFGLGYFPKAIVRQPVENLFRQPKPAATYRIFLLGSSAAIGVPDAAFDFARVLGAMLDQTFPGTRFEVVITGLTATNSHVVLPIARECTRYDPDLFLLYVGNNEVIGPYGIQTDRRGRAPGLRTIRTGIALRKTKLGQLLQGIVERGSGQDEAYKEWRGMEMYSDTHVRSGAPELERIYANYRRNLEDICRTAGDAGADIVVCTVASNLVDSPPFGSLHREDLTDAELRDWNTFYRAGEAYYQEGDHANALEQFRRAAAIDDTHAALHFRMGQCHVHRGELEPALDELRRARELDTLRFRADDRLNAIVREVVARRRPASRAPGGLPGGLRGGSDARRGHPRQGAVLRTRAFHLRGQLRGGARDLPDCGGGIASRHPAARSRRPAASVARRLRPRPRLHALERVPDDRSDGQHAVVAATVHRTARSPADHGLLDGSHRRAAPPLAVPRRRSGSTTPTSRRCGRGPRTCC